ncbi:MAG: hypothetical protein J6Q48_02800 [Bacteroidaceae bacterium]|jgi:hypothetical protein|nr:hypothetical protein [Bacteroidaceae bacterium]
MASKLKIAGIAVFIIGAILIILSHFLGWNNMNIVNFGSIALMIVGLVTYIMANKKILEEK